MELPEYYEGRRDLVMTNAKNKEDYVTKLSLLCQENDKIEMQLYTKYQVKRGLRDENGKGVLAGLTKSTEKWFLNAVSCVIEE